MACVSTFVRSSFHVERKRHPASTPVELPLAIRDADTAEVVSVTCPGRPPSRGLPASAHPLGSPARRCHAISVLWALHVSGPAAQPCIASRPLHHRKQFSERVVRNHAEVCTKSG